MDMINIIKNATILKIDSMITDFDVMSLRGYVFNFILIKNNVFDKLINSELYKEIIIHLKSETGLIIKF